MTHQQILDKLAAKHLVKSIDEDLSRLVFYAMCYNKDSIEKQLAYFLPNLLLRWNCVLKAGKEVSDNYKEITILAIAVLLHKYGYADNSITKQAIEAIDHLNKKVVLGDDFFRKSDEIKNILSSLPISLKRKPTIAESITFYRKKDVISIQLDGKYYAAYIHELTGINESPKIEFYNGMFDNIPTLKDIEQLPAIGYIKDNGLEYRSFFAVYGMKFLPDPANQIQLISACVQQKPANNHLQVPSGLFAMSDLFEIQKSIQGLFKNHRNFPNNHGKLPE